MNTIRPGDRVRFDGWSGTITAVYQAHDDEPRASVTFTHGTISVAVRFLERVP